MEIRKGIIEYEDYINTGTIGSEPIYKIKKTVFEKIRYVGERMVKIPSYKVIIIQA